MTELIQVQFTGKYHHIGITGIKPDSIDVSYIKLSGQMDLHTKFSGIFNDRNIAYN